MYVKNRVQTKIFQEKKNEKRTIDKKNTVLRLY